MVSVAERRLKLSDGKIFVEIIMRRRYKYLKNYSGQHSTAFALIIIIIKNLCVEEQDRICTHSQAEIHFQNNNDSAVIINHTSNNQINRFHAEKRPRWNQRR